MKQIIEVSSGGIVYRKIDGQTLWLITQHSEHKGWSFPKGIIGDEKENELKEEAALREVREEGGVTAKIINDDPVQTLYTYKNKKGELVNKTVYYFLMEYVSGNPNDHDWEVSEAKFVTADVVKKTLTYQGDKNAFEKILELKSVV